MNGLTQAVVDAAPFTSTLTPEPTPTHAWLRNPALPVVCLAFSAAPTALAAATQGLAAAGLVFALHVAAAWRARAHADRLTREERMAELVRERDAARERLDDRTHAIAAAGHDLRQPVQAISLLAATLAQRLAGREEHALAQQVLTATQQLDHSCRSLLDVRRVAQSAAQAQTGRVNLGEMFRHLHKRFDPQAQSNGLALRFRPGGRSVVADREALERMLANLIQNALKYTRNGGVLVVARGSGRRVRIEVWDTGIGIAAVHLPYVTKPFYRVPLPTTMGIEGHGMGLSIVDRLCRHHRWAFTIDSRERRGTRVRVSIPG